MHSKKKIEQSVSVRFKDGLREIPISASKLLQTFVSSMETPTEFAVPHEFSVADYDASSKPDCTLAILRLSDYFGLSTYNTLLRSCSLDPAEIPEPYSTHIRVCRLPKELLVADNRLLRVYVSIFGVWTDRIIYETCAARGWLEIFKNEPLDSKLHRHGYDVIQIACFHGHLALVRFFLENAETLWMKRLQWCLTKACDGGHLELIRYLIEEHNVDATHQSSLSIRKAAIHGNLALIQYLGARGADMRACNDEVFRVSVQINAEQVIRYLVETVGVPISNNNYYILIEATKRNYLNILRYAIAKSPTDLISTNSILRQRMMDKALGQKPTNLDTLRYLHEIGIPLNGEPGCHFEDRFCFIAGVILQKRIDALELYYHSLGYPYCALPVSALRSMVSVNSVELIEWFPKQGFQLDLNANREELMIEAIAYDADKSFSWLHEHLDECSPEFWTECFHASKLFNAERVRPLVSAICLKQRTTTT